MSRLSVIIATMERERELYRCLESIWAQSRLPQELVIVDDGALDLEALRAKVPREVEFQYYRKSPPGLSASRNLGARVAKGEILLFLDDDVVLEPDFIEEILKVFHEDKTGRLGGVSGVITNRKPKPKLFRLWAEFFLMEKGPPGRLLPWGYFSSANVPEAVIEVQWVPGGLSCFREEVLRQFKFSDMNQKGRHGLADVEFGWRVSARYTLKTTPFARLAHYPPARSSRGAIQRGLRQVMGHAHLFCLYGEQGLFNKAKFLWATLGLVLGNLGAALLVKEKGERIWRLLLGLGNLFGAIKILPQVVVRKGLSAKVPQ